MKNLIVSISVIITLSVITSCNEDLPQIGDAGSKLDGINADWVMQNAYLTDETQVEKEFFSIAEYYLTGDAPTVTFNSETKKYNFDFKSKKNLFATTGSWEFDDDFAPTKVVLTDVENGVIESTLGTTIRPQDQLLYLQFHRDCNGETTNTYTLEYIRK